MGIGMVEIAGERRKRVMKAFIVVCAIFNDLKNLSNGRIVSEQALKYEVELWMLMTVDLLVFLYSFVTT